MLVTLVDEIWRTIPTWVVPDENYLFGLKRGTTSRN